MLQDLIETYKREAATWTEREKADFEIRIFDASTTEKVRDHKEYRSAYLWRVLGGKRHTYEYRFTLVHGAADPLLWASIQAGTSLRVAVILHRAAKELATTAGIAYHDAMMRVLAERANGAPAESTRPKRKRVKAAKVKPETSRDGWKAIRYHLAQLVGERLKDADPAFAESIHEEFIKDAQVLCSVYQNRIKRVIELTRGTRSHVESLTLDTLNDALLTLAHDPLPRLGLPVDRVQLKKSYRSLVKQFHPDSNGGNDVLRANFEAVQNAYNIVEEYQSTYGESAHVA
jgi:hypothetical protein